MANYVKLHEAWFTSVSHFEFSAATHGVGLRLLTLAKRGVETDGVQWIVGHNGKPYEAKHLAAMCKLRPREFAAELAKIVAVRTLVRRDDGALGFPRFEHWQTAERDMYTQPPPRPPGFVYLIVAGSRVKIGYSANPWSRLAELRTGSAIEMTLVSMTLGTIEDESALHRQFAEHRVQGEWFNLEGELAEFVANRSTTNPPSVATNRSRRSTTVVATNPSSTPPPTPSPQQ